MQKVVANVIGSDATGLSRTLILSAGTHGGLSPGMVVLSSEGVVGKLISASPSSARVLLIDDHNSALDAFDQRSRLRGIVAGTVEGGLTMMIALGELAAAARSDSSPEGKILSERVSEIVEQLKAHLLTVDQARAELRALMKYIECSVPIGDSVVTSGLDGKFPRGLLIGEVGPVHVESQGSDLFVNVFIAPAVDFRRLEQVLILVPEPEPPTAPVMPLPEIGRQAQNEVQQKRIRAAASRASGRLKKAHQN